MVHHAGHTPEGFPLSQWPAEIDTQSHGGSIRGSRIESNTDASPAQVEKKKPWYKKAKNVGIAAVAFVATVGTTIGITLAATADRGEEGMHPDQSKAPVVAPPIAGSESQTPPSSPNVVPSTIPNESQLPKRSEIVPTNELSVFEELLTNPELDPEVAVEYIRKCIQSHVQYYIDTDNYEEARDAVASYYLGLYYPESDQPKLPGERDPSPIVDHNMAKRYAETWVNEVQAYSKAKNLPYGYRLDWEPETIGLSDGFGEWTVIKDGQEVSFTYRPKAWTITRQIPGYEPDIIESVGNQHYIFAPVFVPDSPEDPKKGSWKLVYPEDYAKHFQIG